MTEATYDLAIIGTGAAGYTASIYASRYNVSNIVIGASVGGQTAEAHLIQNYPSYIEIRGSELMEKMKNHVETYGNPIVFDNVDKITGREGDFTIETQSGTSYNAKSLLLAIGMKRRKLGVDGEERLLGKGVTYCSTCDGPFYKNKTVAIIGGSDSANTASLYFSTLASKVFQIYRKDKLRGEPAWADKVVANYKIELIYNTTVVGINGEEKLTSVTLDKPYQGSDKLELDGLFIEIGAEPDPTLPKQLNLELDENNFIKVEKDQKTNVPGIWAAGDITTNSNHFHQTITAAAEGAVAAHNVFTTLQ